MDVASAFKVHLALAFAATRGFGQVIACDGGTVALRPHLAYE
jgi:hypothetical protein